MHVSQQRKCNAMHGFAIINNTINVFSTQACACMRLACITKPICRLKRLFSFCPLNVMAPVLRMALHAAYLLECKQNT